MTHVTPGGGGTAPPSALVSRPSPDLRPPASVTPRLDHEQIRDRIVQHRACLAELEAALVAACEAAAARHWTSAVHVADRATWDRPMWQRYLDAATVLEPEYGPRMRDLLRDIDRLERLLALPASCGRIAG
jgi:hypothetical protein